MASFLKFLIAIIVLAVVAVGGLWGYKTYSIASANDEMWVAINSRLPAPLRTWSCDTVKERIKPKAGGKAPAGCDWK
ncbi:MAG: hypothetical protein KDJ41_06300 [Hyphomicrobiaceae bacterium]|nr:hypothetical protein [Hyphomicrobiaceae bacterium]